MTYKKDHCLTNTFFSVFTTNDTSVPLSNESFDSNIIIHHHLELSESDTYNALAS